MRSRRAVSVGVLVAALAVAGCSSDDSASTTDHNEADVAFATEMVPHHEQALLMVAMTEGRSLSPDFEHLTEHIRDAQTPEIETMEGWLEDWGEPEPSGPAHGMGSGGMGSGGMGSGGMGSGGMGPGMMDDDDLGDLGDLADSSRSLFEQMWLRMMIVHHEGAIEMSEDELDDGRYQPTLDLAQSIITTQTAEIEQMEQMLGE